MPEGDDAVSPAGDESAAAAGSGAAQGTVQCLKTEHEMAPRSSAAIDPDPNGVLIRHCAPLAVYCSMQSGGWGPREVGTTRAKLQERAT